MSLALNRKFFNASDTFLSIEREKEKYKLHIPTNYLLWFEETSTEPQTMPKTEPAVKTDKSDETSVPVEEIEFDNVSGLNKRMLGFLELCKSFPSLARKMKITSGYRAGAVTSKGRDSNHKYGDAIDIVPINGSFDELAQELFSHPEIVSYLRRYNLGIIDETLPYTMALTGASGQHFHIGPDKIGLSGIHSLLTKYGFA